jgi:hypothetical protein
LRLWTEDGYMVMREESRVAKMVNGLYTRGTTG